MTGLYAHKLPPASPTLLQLALAVISSKRAQRANLAKVDDWSEMDCARQDRLDDAHLDAVNAFFAALESKDGIDRDIFDKLGDAL